MVMRRSKAWGGSMLILGGLIGFAVCFVLVATPLAAVLATQLGLALVIPVVGLGLAPLFTAPVLLIALIHIVLVLFLYVIISLAIAPNIPASGPLPVPAAGTPSAGWQLTERFARGALIGMNACFTMLLTWLLLPWIAQPIPTLGSVLLLSSPLLGIAGFVIAIINLMALDESICADRSYAAVLGWTSWVAAGSMVVNLLGLLFWIISVVASWFGSTLRLAFEWWTGSWVIHGGPLHVTAVPTAYDLGNFLLVDPRLSATSPVFLPQVNVAGTALDLVHGATAIGLAFHETGHTLNVAAFGSWFHLIGAIDENYISSNGAAVYSELLPEGHARDSTRPWIALWAPPLGNVGAGANVPPRVGAPTVNGVGLVGGVATVVIAAGSTATLTGATASDPDTFPQGAVSPGVTPAVGTLWEIVARPAGSSAAVAAINSADTTAAFDVGGDYTVLFAVTDGIELSGGGQLSSVGVAGLDLFLLSVVEARITGAAQVANGATITLSAASSTAGSAGAATVGAAPLLSMTWSTAPGSGVTLTPRAEPELIDVRGTLVGTFSVTLTVTEQFTGTSVSHSATVTVTVI